MVGRKGVCKILHMFVVVVLVVVVVVVVVVGLGS